MQPKIEAIKKVIAKKVKGKVIAEHDERGHHYRIGKGITSELVDSVTTKLILEKPHLVSWAVRMGFEWMEGKWASMDKLNRESYLQGAILAHTEIRDQAGSIGSQAHDILERWVNAWIDTGERPRDIKEFVIEGTNYRAVASARSGEALFIKSGCIPIASELLVGVKRYHSAGTLDMLVWNHKTEQIELWDWKTSNAVNDSYALQVSAYKKFFEVMTGLKIDTCKIIHLSKESDHYAVYLIPEIDEVFKTFLAISKVYDWRENGKKKLEKDIKTITF